METVQVIMTKRIADVKHLSGKQMSRLLKKKIDRRTKLKVKPIFPEPDDLRTYIATLKQVHSSPISDTSLNAIQGYEYFDDAQSKIAAIETKFGADYTQKLHSVLTEHSAALKQL